jgi:acetolactate synthase I/II/III large subunit
MLGMHGLYEANLAMHGCDTMINIGARFDDRITGRIKDFSPGSKKAHIDIDPSSINKVIRVDVPIVGDIASVLEEVLRQWRARGSRTHKAGLAKWWKQDQRMAGGEVPDLQELHHHDQTAIRA